MGKFQCFVYVLKRSCICYYIICMTVPLKKNFLLKSIPCKRRFLNTCVSWIHRGSLALVSLKFLVFQKSFVQRPLSLIVFISKFSSVWVGRCSYIFWPNSLSLMKFFFIRIFNPLILTTTISSKKLKATILGLFVDW